MKTLIAAALEQRFGPEYVALLSSDKTNIEDDFRDVLRSEYDVPDESMDAMVAQENILEASREYRRRIGGGNLESYAKCLRPKRAK